MTASRLRRLVGADGLAAGVIVAATGALWVPYAVHAQFNYDDWRSVADSTFGRSGSSRSRTTMPRGVVR